MVVFIFLYIALLAQNFSHQEMSTQQVASYLMDFQDHFTSHKYVSMFWTSFERFVNENDPSPKCYPTTPAATDSPEVENAALETVMGQEDTVDNRQSDVS